MSTSHSRTVWSPAPVASSLPPGANCAETIGLAWPGSVDVQRVTARTRKTACGTYTTRTACSVDAPPIAAASDEDTSSSAT